MGDWVCSMRDCHWRIWRALLAEFLANLLLNFFGCAACVHVSDTKHSFVHISLAFGLIIFVLVQSLGHVSGAHINPAVTAGMMFVQNISVCKGVLYMIAQCLGAVSGSGILKFLLPEKIQEGVMGNTEVNKDLTVFQAFGFEFFLGFILVLVVYGVCDDQRPNAKPCAALAIGMTVTVGHLATVDATGASMNPARSLGSAIVSQEWDNLWVYWVGPICGGITAAVTYRLAFLQEDVRDEESDDALDERELQRLDGRKARA